MSGEAAVSRDRSRLTLRLLAAILASLVLGPRVLHPAAAELSDLEVLSLGIALGLLASAQASRRTRHRVLVAAGAGLATLVAAELLLRPWLGSHYASLYQYDEHCLHRLIPGAEHLYRHAPVNGGREILVKINEDGYRGPPLLPRDPTRPRVAVYGDSFIAAEFSADENTFVRRLEQDLSVAQGRAVEVVNAGVAAYGPDQVSRRLDTELEALHPDLLVVGVYAGNDFGDLVRNELFRVDASGSLVATEPEIAPGLRWELWLARHEPLVLKMLAEGLHVLRSHVTWRLEHWDAAAASPADGEPTPEADPSFVEACREQVSEEYRHHVRMGRREVDALFGDPYNAQVALEPDGEPARYKKELMAGVLGRIAGQARRAGVPLLLVVIPSPIDVCDRHDLGTVDARRYPGYRRDGLTDAVAAITGDLGVPCVDLFAPFRGPGAEDLFLRGHDDHWNDAGQALAARVVAGVIEAGGWLDGAGR
jgi:hypothetical protein